MAFQVNVKSLIAFGVTLSDRVAPELLRLLDAEPSWALLEWSLDTLVELLLTTCSELLDELTDSKLFEFELVLTSLEELLVELILETLLEPSELLSTELL